MVAAGTEARERAGPASDARARSPPPIREPLAAGSAPRRRVQRSSARCNTTAFLQRSGGGLVSPGPGDLRRALQGSCELGWRGSRVSGFLPSKRVPLHLRGQAEVLEKWGVEVTFPVRGTPKPSSPSPVFSSVPA